MPDQKISDLGDGGAPQPTDEFVIARGTTNNKLDWASMSAAATAGNIAATISGNTAGAGALVSSGTVTLAGGNNITLSQAGNAITISGAAAGGVQTAISGIAASNTTYTSGTVTLTGVGGGVTVGSNTGQRVDISVAAPVAQTTQTQNVHNVTLSGNTAGVMAQVSSGTLTLAGGNNITVSQNGNAITISGANVGGAQTGISGIAASNTTYTSGSVTITGVGGGITVSSNTGQRIDLSVAAQSVQPETQTFVAGIQNSQTTYTSGTVNLSVNGGLMTIRSTTGQAFQFSVSQSVQPETQTFLGAIQNSQTTYTSGTVNLSVVAGNLTIRSTTGQAFQFSASQTVQPETQTAISGIANSQTTYTSGTVSLSELGAITIRSTTGNQYQLSVNAQTTQTQGILSAGVSTGGNTAGNTTVNTGSRFVLAVTGNATASQATAAGASTVTISVGTQTVQTQGVLSVGASTGGNTSGNTTVNTGSRLVFVGSNNITISQGTAAGATTLTISGPSVAGAQTGISGIANSQTTYTSGTVSLSELGAITIRSTTGNQFQLSVNAQTAQTGISGIANSQTTYTSGTVSLSELGAITIRSTTGNQYQLSVNAQTTQTQGILSAGVSTGGNTAGNTQVSTGSRLVIVGSNGITASQGTAAGATTITLSGATQTVQTQGILSAGVSNIGNSAGNTTVNTGSRFVLAGGNNVTLSQSTAAGATTVTVSAGGGVETQTAISGIANSQTTYTSGTVSLSELGAITIRSTTGNQFQFSVNAQTNQTGTVYAASNTFGTSSGTYDASRISIAGDGIVSVAASNSGWRISATQSVQTQGVLSAGVSNVGNTSGNTTVNTGSRLVLAGGNNITLSQSTAAGATTITVSAPNLGAGAFSGGASNLGNTAGNTGITGTQLVLVGSGVVSLSQTTGANGGTLSILAPAASSLSATGIVSITDNGSTISIGAPAYSAGISTNGNTAGNTGFASQRLMLAGGNNITLSGSTNGGSMSLTISAGAGGGGGVNAGVSTMGNTAGSTGTVSTGNVVFVGSGPISLSQSTGAAGSAATISINAPATSSLLGTGGIQISTNGSTISIGDGGRSLADWQNFPQGQAALETHIASISKTPFYWNENIPGRMTANSLAFRISMVTASQPLSLSAHLGIYTKVNSTSMALLGSVSEAYVVSSASSVSFSGIRNLVMTGIGTHTALSVLTGGNYGIGMMFSAGASQSMNASLMGASTANGPLGMLFPGTNSMSTATSQGVQGLWGRGSTTVNAMPANVVRSELINQGSGASMQLHPWIYVRS